MNSLVLDLVHVWIRKIKQRIDLSLGYRNGICADLPFLFKITNARHTIKLDPLRLVFINLDFLAFTLASLPLFSSFSLTITLS